MLAKFKSIFLLLSDALIIISSQIFTLFLLGEKYLNILTPVSTAIIFMTIGWIIGLYRTRISHLGITAAWQVLISTLAASLIMFLYKESFSLILFSSILSFIGIISYRVLVREVLFQQRHSNAARTLVYGAGAAGIQFVTASMQGDTHNVIGYIDDDSDLCGTSIHGRNVYPSKSINKLIKKYNIHLIVLALPSIANTKRKKIIESLIPLPVRVVTIPTFEDLIEGKQITQTEDITVDDLLGRDSIPPIDEYMKVQTQGKVCLVSGAGGSIGSELCRQIVKCNPKHLILLDISEPALFDIEQDMLQAKFTKISCYLGSVTDNNLIDKIFYENNFH